jgi:hypothetical protein
VDLHGVLIAPHGTGDGLIGLAALVQASATSPQNFIAFEYRIGQPDWCYEKLEGLPDPIVSDGFIDVRDRPGMGVDFNAARPGAPANRGRDVFQSTPSRGLIATSIPANRRRHRRAGGRLACRMTRSPSRRQRSFGHHWSFCALHHAPGEIPEGVNDDRGPVQPYS